MLFAPVTKLQEYSKEANDLFQSSQGFTMRVVVYSRVFHVLAFFSCGRGWGFDVDPACLSAGLILTCSPQNESLKWHVSVCNQPIVQKRCENEQRKPCSLALSMWTGNQGKHAAQGKYHKLDCDTSTELNIMQLLKYLQRICSKRKCFMVSKKAVLLF